ncbi:MAG: type II toxin-antitoxin system MqsR family toxin [Candidatus Riflebacteria bacterium]|nr:type II toxin-antitoxin system MqsR family toxin [Candidatus Riflebacteria bacterium]
MTRTQPFYSKKNIISLVKSGKIFVTSKARLMAKDDFGWGIVEIGKALTALKVKDWYKSDKRFDNPDIWVDYYRAENLNGENVYTHFYVEADQLVVDSFKEL